MWVVFSWLGHGRLFQDLTPRNKLRYARHRANAAIYDRKEGGDLWVCLFGV